MSEELEGRIARVDLDNCDQEPIHIPGSIQPHGVLLACHPETLVVEQVSQNVEQFLGMQAGDVLGRSLLTLFERACHPDLEAVVSLEHPRENCPLRLVLPDGKPFDAVVHRSGEVLVVELEDFQDLPGTFHPQLRRSVARLHDALNPDELCRVAVEELRSLTGFDRVMAYRFDQEWNGSVVAEAKHEQLASLLGQQYPASDIPAQARRLYTVNWLRFVVDARYEPSPLLPADNPRTGEPLDLSASVLRSVSPIHCEYLQNMGVAASMSVSLVHGGKLWGLLACHHYSEKKRVPYSVRDSCEFLARTLSWQIASYEQAARASAEAETARIERVVYDEMMNARDFRDGLVTKNLCALTEAQGVAVIYEGAVRSFGHVPVEEQIRDIAGWVESRLDDGMFVTDRLPKLWPVPELDDCATGLLAVAISPAYGDYVLWFRPSTEAVVDWAGHPYKDVVLQDGVPRLSPRGSFELWRETVRGRSLPWQTWHVQGALHVRRAVLGGVRRRSAEIQDFNQRLIEFDRAKDLFIATVSHELRTPLNAITGWVELLREGSVDEARRAHGLAVIHRNAQAQARLVDDLIDMSRIANGKFSLAVERLDFAQVVEQAVESLVLAAEAKAIRLVRVIDSAGTTLLGDQRRLQQVVWNLVSNAIKFTPKQGKIELVLRRRQSDVELSVADTGQGIAPEFMPFLFDPFRQADNKPQSERKGLGLGLSISRHIVEAHGGQISVESPGPGRGCTFTVRVPVSLLLAKSEPPPADGSSPAIRGELEGVKILVVEDDADSLDLLKSLLEAAGATVMATSSAEDALTSLVDQLPELILSDVGLPGMDGYTFISKLRSLPENLGGAIPAAALTAHTRSKDRTEALRAGFQSYVPKPVDPGELLAVLQSLLSRRTPI